MSDDQYRPGHDDLADTLHAMDLALDSVNDLRSQLIAGARAVRVLGRAVDALALEALRAPDLIADREAFDLGEEHFDYIAMPVEDFVGHLFELDRLLRDDPDHAHAQLRYRPVSYVEVGCGPGRNLHILRTADSLLWDRAEGFDIVPPYIEAARRAFDLGDSVQVADATTFDFSPYSVVFSYRPFSDAKREAAYEAHLVETMPVGGYILAPLCESLNTMRRLMPLGESGVIWKKLS